MAWVSGQLVQNEVNRSAEVVHVVAARYRGKPKHQPSFVTRLAASWDRFFDNALNDTLNWDKQEE